MIMRTNKILYISILFVCIKSIAQITINTTMPSTTVENPVSITFSPGFFATTSNSSYVFLARIGNLNYQADYKNAPNSYIYDPLVNVGNDGIMIPVKKAFDMWGTSDKLDNQKLTGNLSAYVYWEDVPGLIIANPDYKLDLLTGSSNEWAKIKVPIDKGKGYGNAVIALHVGNNGNATDPIAWSWHVWVTDDPTNGASFGHTDDNGNKLEFIGNTNTPDKQFVPKFMDRNLGAKSTKIVGKDWNKAGGLMYQWGRKDPFPPLVYRDGTHYELNGESGNRKPNTYLFNYNKTLVNSSLKENIKESIKKPLQLITNKVYVNQSTPVTNYNNILTWFAGDSTTDLWSDNAKGLANGDAFPRGYQLKSAFDPCPNRWRIPSLLNGNPNNPASSGIYFRFNPFGQNKKAIVFPDSREGLIIKPVGYNTIPNDPLNNSYYSGIKVYPGLGFDMSNIDTGNMGIYPGTGLVYEPGNTINGGVFESAHNFYYNDTHETRLWTASIGNNGSAEKYKPMMIRFLPDPGSPNHQPDPINFPTLKGWFSIQSDASESSALAACRCMQDPYYQIDASNYVNYDFPVDYLTEQQNYMNYVDGINNPNSYLLTKDALNTQEISIPINKAFSIYNQFLSNHGFPPHDNLIPNVFWTTNKTLIKKISISNSTGDVKNSVINVTIAANNSGNALISLHNGSIANPVIWSWHIWVSNTNPEEVSYTTENNNIFPSNSNYVGFTNSGHPAQTNIFMDRNLGALDAIPSIATNDATGIMNFIKNSAGLLYQWGRKDPIPIFYSPGYAYNNLNNLIGDVQPIYRAPNGLVFDTNNNILTQSYTETVTDTTYRNTYAKLYNGFINSGDTSSDPKPLKIQKHLLKAVENPFTFIHQDHVNASGIAYKDWLTDEPNSLPDRWGHSTTKSPFDPCPENWRVPDNGNITNLYTKEVSPNNFLILNNKGKSPWYFGRYNPINSTDFYSYYYTFGFLESTGSLIAPYNGIYPGKLININENRFALQFDQSQFQIGNFPITAIRGAYEGDLGYSALGFGMFGLWSSS